MSNLLCPVAYLQCGLRGARGKLGEQTRQHCPHGFLSASIISPLISAYRTPPSDKPKGRVLSDHLQGKFAPNEGAQVWGSRVVTARMGDAGKLGGCQGGARTLGFGCMAGSGHTFRFEELCIKGKKPENHETERAGSGKILLTAQHTTSPGLHG